MSEHQERMQRIRQNFATANAELIGAIERLDDATAGHAEPGAWNPAQIGWHVATTTEFLSGGMAGTIAQVMVPRPEDFHEQLAEIKLPEKIKTFPMLEPPADAARDTAVAKLRASEAVFAKACDAVSEDRCAAQCVQLPFGVFSLYEIGEFTTAHIHRHMGQVQRTVAGN